MLGENRGQISLEYLLIFSISLIVLVVFTLPLLEFGVENTLDVSDSLKVKSDLSKISSAVSQVYAEGQGSRQTVHIQSDKSIKVSIDENHLSTNLKLNDNSNKLIKTQHSSNLEKSSINLKKGNNFIVVEWPVGSENVQIHF